MNKLHVREFGISTLEVVVVLVVVTLLASALLQRLGGLSAEARQVQLRMTVENVRSNAILLQLRCGNGDDPACWQRALATALRAGVGGLPPALAADAKPPREPANAIGRLRTVALAAGLGEHGGRSLGWTLRPEGPNSLTVSLKAVPECRFSMHWIAASAAVTVQDVEDRC